MKPVASNSSRTGPALPDLGPRLNSPGSSAWAFGILAVLWGCGSGSGGPSGVDASGGDSSSARTACGDSTDILLSNGTPSGYAMCADGAVDRVSGGAFDATIPDEARCKGTEELMDCTADDACAERENGACVHIAGNGDMASKCGCAYACASDADCAAGSVCTPPEVFANRAAYPTCQPAQCVTDSDCASGECGVVAYETGCTSRIYHACREETADECRTDNDCADEQACGFESQSDFACVSTECFEG